MDVRLKELMAEAGYAAPEMAMRAQKLVSLIREDLRKSLKDLATGFTDKTEEGIELAAFYIAGMYTGDNYDKE